MHSRSVELSFEAGAALRQILGIMIDQSMAGDGWAWDLEHVVMLDGHLEAHWSDDEWTASAGGDRGVELRIDDAALLLQGMAFTEVASAELPWIEMVRWTTDFVTAQLRQPWTEDEWRAVSARAR
jgi:hypothetical protein